MFYEDAVITNPLVQDVYVPMTLDNLKRLTAEAKQEIESHREAWLQDRIKVELPRHTGRTFIDWLRGKPLPTPQEAEASAKAAVEEREVYPHEYTMRMVFTLHKIAHKVDYLGAPKVPKYAFDKLVHIASGCFDS